MVVTENDKIRKQLKHLPIDWVEEAIQTIDDAMDGVDIVNHGGLDGRTFYIKQADKLPQAERKQSAIQLEFKQLPDLSERTVTLNIVHPIRD